MTRLAPVLARPWLDVALPARMRMLGWCLNAPGHVAADRVHWREVRDDDLPEGLDVGAWLARDLAASGRTGPCFLTSRDVSRHVVRHAESDGAAAGAVATVGLSNAERIGRRAGGYAATGTINVLVVASVPLGEGALVEAVSLAAEARTAAVMEAGPLLPSGRATGTGTDCLLVAAPDGAGAAHAGKHTAIGEAIGRAVHDAVACGVADWMEEWA